MTAATRDGVESQSISFVNMNPGAVLEPLDIQPGQTNLLLGNDRSRWASNLPMSGRLRYRNLYSGINLLFYWNGGQLEYDFAVAPGADPNQIRLRIDGDRGLRVTGSGDLEVGTGAAAVVHRPVLYQNTNAAPGVDRDGGVAIVAGQCWPDRRDYRTVREDGEEDVVSAGPGVAICELRL